MIIGTGFGDSATVTFGGVAATSVVVIDSEHITCVTPAHAFGAVDVVVTNADGQNATLDNGFRYTKTAFDSPVPQLLETPALEDPLHPGEVLDPDEPLPVRGPGDPALKPLPAPTLEDARDFGSGLVPNFGSSLGGDFVFIIGNHFDSSLTVTFDDTAATGVVVVSSILAYCVTPENFAGLVDVIIETDDRTGIFFNGFLYVNPEPIVSTITPTKSSTEGGDTIIVHGDKFLDSTVVFFNGLQAFPVVVDSSTQITCDTQAHEPGTVPVIPFTPD